MRRKELPRDQLITLINTKLSTGKDTAGCSFNCIYKLSACDENGCNWIWGQFNSKKIPIEVSEPVVINLMVKLQEKYNIK